MLIKRKPIQILLVEDDPAHVAAIKRALKTSTPDIKVHVAGTLDAFRQAVADSPPDIAIMDLNLPDGSALEVLISPPEAGPFPVVIMTSYGNEQMAVEVLKTGALDYVVKSPEVFIGMLHTVDGVMREWKLLQERKQIEETLRKSEENFHHSLDDSPLGVRILTAKGETIYANRALLDLYGYGSVEEINMIPLKERYTPQSYDEFKKRRKAREEGRFGPSEYEIAIVRKNKEIRYLQVFRKEVLWNGSKQFQTIYLDISARKRAESQREAALEALRESEERFRIAGESASDLIWEWNIVNGKLEWFGAIDEILGYAPGEFPRTIDFWKSIIHVDDRDRVLAAIDQHLKTHSPYREDYRVCRKDGTMGYWTDKGVALFNKQDHPYKMIGVCTDISQQKLAEDNLVKSKDLLSETEKMGKIGGWIFDAEKLTQTWTEETFRILEIDLTDGEPKVPEGLGFVAPASRPMADQAVRRAIEFGEPYDQEWEIITAKGNKRWVHAVANIHKEHGKTKRVSGSFQDISERKRAEFQMEAALEALRREKYFAESLVQTAQTIVLVLDTTGCIVSFNPYMEKISGYPLKEVLGKDWFSTFLPGHIQNKIRELFSKAIAGIQTEGNIDKIVTRDGREIDIEWYDKTLKDEKNNVIGLLAIGKDITERKRAEEVIRSSLAEKEVLLKEVHHRVKNNLMTIIGLIKMQEAKADNEKFSPLLQELEGRVRSIALVHESLYKSENLARVDLQNYVEKLSAQICAQFGTESNIHFRVQAVGVEVDLDIAVSCGLILNELISNAYKHAFPAGQPGEICVSFQERTGTDGENAPTFELTVADNGVGLPAGLDWEKSETLGLQLIRMLSQQINGSIELDRTHGTSFLLRFAHSSIAGRE